jgi:hypothetical protein
MSKPTAQRTDRRTTISLDPVVWDWAQQLMKDKGFNNNLSNYIADLIRRDQERKEEKMLKASTDPSDKASTLRYHEAPAAAAPPPKNKKAA